MIRKKETTDEQGWCYRLKHGAGKATAKRFRPSNVYHNSFQIMDYIMTNLQKTRLATILDFVPDGGI